MPARRHVSRFSARAALRGAAAGLLALAMSAAAPAMSQERIVTLGGDVTEIVYALGAEDRIAATDTTSLYPPAALETPKVGYVRRLSAEGVLSLEPDLIITSAAIGPDAAAELLEASGVEFLRLPQDYTIEGIYGKVEAIAARLGREAEGAALIADIEADWRTAEAEIAAQDGTPSAIFFFSSEGATRAAGTETAADAVIALAGGRNVFTEHTGVKAFSFESVVQKDPDVILVMAHQADEMGGVETIRTHPALSLTRAAQTGAIVAVDAAPLLQFGPRTPAAVAELARQMRAAREDQTSAAPVRAAR